LLCSLFHSLLTYIWFFIFWILLLIIIHSSLAIIAIFKIWSNLFIPNTRKYTLPPFIILFVICSNTHFILFFRFRFENRIMGSMIRLGTGLNFRSRFLYQILLPFLYVIVSILSLVNTTLKLHIIRIVLLDCRMLVHFYLASLKN
jgi:hypothetical protein